MAVRVEPLNHEEGWAPRNWCFWTVVLQKTLENHLDSKEIKPVNRKGNQPWILIGWTDAEAETPILWLPDATLATHWKRPWCWERLRARGEGGDRVWNGWMALPTQWTLISANSRRWLRTGKPGMVQFMGSQRIGHRLDSEQCLLSWPCLTEQSRDSVTC